MTDPKPMHQAGEPRRVLPYGVGMSILPGRPRPSFSDALAPKFVSLNMLRLRAQRLLRLR